MFQHLVKENELDKDNSLYFGDRTRNKKFITELIEGLTKDETRVHKTQFILYDLCLKTVVHILIHFVNGR